MNKVSSIIIILGFAIAASIILVGGFKKNSDQVSVQPEQNIEIKDGVQYITISAKGGYSPKNSIAQAGIPTKLIVTTNGTYDCSSSLVIRSLKYQKMLPQTGEEIIGVGVPEAGTSLQGTCGMGMYSFSINFN